MLSFSLAESISSRFSKRHYLKKNKVKRASKMVLQEKPRNLKPIPVNRTTKRELMPSDLQMHTVCHLNKEGSVIKRVNLK